MPLKFPLTVALKWTLKRVHRRGKKPFKQAIFRKVVALLWNVCFSWFYLFLWQRTVQGVAESHNTPAPAEVFHSNYQYLWGLIKEILFLDSMVAQSDYTLMQMAGKIVSLPWGLFIEDFGDCFWFWLVCLLVAFPKKIYKNLFHNDIWHYVYLLWTFF